MDDDKGLYCDKCGMTYGNYGTISVCNICGNELKVVPNEYFITEEEKEFCELSEEMKQKLRKDLVLTSSNFDQYYFDHRDELIGKFLKSVHEGAADLARIRAKNRGTDIGNKYGITCPYCHATNITKIDVLTRSFSAAIFGLGSKKLGKQWHCDHCGSDF